MKPNRQQTDRQKKKTEEALCEALGSLDSVDEIRNFLLDLCTPAELQALVDRWQVVALLEANIPYRQIHDQTGVSVTTIGRVARFLTDGSGGYQTALQRSNQNTTGNIPGPTKE
jgi:TrpR-related protein YerC/YecD